MSKKREKTPIIERILIGVVIGGSTLMLCLGVLNIFLVGCVIGSLIILIGLLIIFSGLVIIFSTPKRRS